MSLVVSLIIPDGIVIAGDSFSTISSSFPISIDDNIKCTNCSNEIHLQKTYNVNLPSSTFSSAQKIIPLYNKYCIGTTGKGLVNGKTIFYHLKTYEKQNPKDPKSVKDLCTKIVDYFRIKMIPEEINNKNMLSFQVVGFDNENAKIEFVEMGDTDSFDTTEEGCKISGDCKVVSDGIWSLYNKYPGDKPVFNLFSLQEAIDYSVFLISTSSNYQKFSKNIQTIGGSIDIGLLTYFGEFKWVQQKELFRELLKTE
jgi:hypothetical protein